MYIMYNKNSFSNVNSQIQLFVVDKLAQVLDQIAERSSLNSKCLPNLVMLE